MEKVYNLKEIDEMLQSEALKAQFKDVAVNLDDGSKNTFSKVKYGSSQNFIMLMKEDGTYMLFERIKKDGTIVEGNVKDDTEWREVNNDLNTENNGD